MKFGHRGLRHQLCLVCRLFRQGKCGTCGGGTEAQAKLATQLSLLGNVCPILQCAVQRGVGWCSADCDIYSCPKFVAGPYPLSEGYLRMQVRRRSQPGRGSAAPASPSPDKPGMH